MNPSFSSEPIEATGRTEIVGPRSLLPAGRPVAAVEGVPQRAAAVTSIALQAGAEELEEVPLDALVADIRELHTELVRPSTQVVRFAVAAGRRLCAARARVPDGSWAKWLASNVDFSDRTAQDYMRIARAFDEGHLDLEHAPESLRAALAKIRGDRRPAEAGDDIVRAWENRRVGFLRSTNEVAELAKSDPRAEAWFRDRIVATQVELSKYIDR